MDESSYADFANLSTSIQRIAGNAPPPLVGASVTILQQTVYVFGGKTITNETVPTLYALSLGSLPEWEQLWPVEGREEATSRQTISPVSRCFHSANVWEDKLVFFGGLSVEQGTETPLNELIIWDTRNHEWLRPHLVGFGVEPPLPRYNHLATTRVSGALNSSQDSSSNSLLFVVGGQTSDSSYIQTAHAFDLTRMAWVASAPFSGETSSVNSTIVNSNQLQVDSSIELSGALNITSSRASRSAVLKCSNIPESATVAQNKTLTTPNPIWFPQSVCCGSHVIVYGLQLAGQLSTYRLFCLDPTSSEGREAKLNSLDVKIEGAWTSAVLFKNQLILFGLASDDNVVFGQMHFGNLLSISLEAFGIYAPPPQRLSLPLQQLGLWTLSQKGLSDFDLISMHGERVSCSRTLLQQRWSWLAAEFRKFDVKTRIMQGRRKGSTCEMLTSSPSVKNVIRVSPRNLELPLSTSACLALAQYFYTFSLTTKPQLDLDVLCELAVFTAVQEDIAPDLAAWVVHTLHQRLLKSPEDAWRIAEIAALSGYTSLALRARMVSISAPLAASHLFDASEHGVKSLPEPPMSAQPSICSTTSLPSILSVTSSNTSMTTVESIPESVAFTDPEESWLQFDEEPNIPQFSVTSPDIAFHKSAPESNEPSEVLLKTPEAAPRRLSFHKLALKLGRPSLRSLPSEDSVEQLSCGEPLTRAVSNSSSHPSLATGNLSTSESTEDLNRLKKVPHRTSSQNLSNLLTSIVPRPEPTYSEVLDSPLDQELNHGMDDSHDRDDSGTIKSKEKERSRLFSFKSDKTKSTPKRSLTERLRAKSQLHLREDSPPPPLPLLSMPNAPSVSPSPSSRKLTPNMPLPSPRAESSSSLSRFWGSSSSTASIKSDQQLNTEFDQLIDPLSNSDRRLFETRKPARNRSTSSAQDSAHGTISVHSVTSTETESRQKRSDSKGDAASVMSNDKATKDVLFDIYGITITSARSKTNAETDSKKGTESKGSVSSKDSGKKDTSFGWMDKAPQVPVASSSRI